MSNRLPNFYKIRAEINSPVTNFNFRKEEFTEIKNNFIYTVLYSNILSIALIVLFFYADNQTFSILNNRCLFRIFELFVFFLIH